MPELTQEQLLARIAELETRDRERSVGEKITALSQDFGDAPAFLKTIEDIMLSDDGGTALLLSDEETGQPRGVTATELVERILEALPKPVKLSEQQIDLSATSAARRPDDKEPSVEDKASAVVEWLGVGRKS